MSAFIKRIVAVSLLILLSGLPSLAQTGPLVQIGPGQASPSDQAGPYPNGREFAFPTGRLALNLDSEGMQFHFTSVAGHFLQGSISRADGAFKLEGLMIQPTDAGLVFSFQGEEVNAVIDPANDSFENPAVTRLMERWRDTQDLADVQGLEMALQTAIIKHAADRGKHLEFALSCGWEILALAAVSGAGYAACTTIIGCGAGYLAFIIQYKRTSDACGWCGAGRAC